MIRFEAKRFRTVTWLNTDTDVAFPNWLHFSWYYSPSLLTWIFVSLANYIDYLIRTDFLVIFFSGGLYPIQQPTCYQFAFILIINVVKLKKKYLKLKKVKNMRINWKTITVSLWYSKVNCLRKSKKFWELRKFSWLLRCKIG